MTRAEKQLEELNERFGALHSLMAADDRKWRALVAAAFFIGGAFGFLVRGWVGWAL